MAIETNDIVTIIEALNKTGGIPLTVTATAQTEWVQFAITVGVGLLGTVFVFFFMWDGFIKPAIGSCYLKIVMHKLVKKTGRHFLIIKHTQEGLFDVSMISRGTLRTVEEAFDYFKGKPFDLILHTPGGEIFATQLISRAIRNYPHPVRAIIPFYAMSGGTMLALSCKEIYMGRYAALGAVDPQLGSIFGGVGSARAWQEVMKIKNKKANDSSIQFAFMGEQYTRTIRTQINELLSDKIVDEATRDATATYLTDGHIEHAFPLTAQDLINLGIPVKTIDEQAAKIIKKVLTNSVIEGTIYV